MYPSCMYRLRLFTDVPPANTCTHIFIPKVISKGGRGENKCLVSLGKQSWRPPQQLSYNHWAFPGSAFMLSTTRKRTGNWINLSHSKRTASESFGYSIKHLSFTRSLSLFCWSHFHHCALIAWRLGDVVKTDTLAQTELHSVSPWLWILNFIHLRFVIICKHEHMVAVLHVTD